MGRPREHDEQTRERLLAAAAEILHAEGVAALSARRLAAEVEVSTRAIYSLFDGMNGVLGELFRRAAEDLVRRHEQVPRRADAAEEIVPLALAYRAGALASPAMYGLLMERAAPQFVPPPELLVYVWRSGARVQDAVERALRQRRLRRDAGLITRQLWSVVHGHASLELKGMLGEPAAAEAQLRSTIETLVAGLLPGRPRA